MAAILLSRRITTTNKLIKPCFPPFLLQNPNNGSSLDSISHSFSTFSEPKPFRNPILNLSQFLLSPKQNLINLPKFYSTNPTSAISQTIEKTQSTNPNFEQNPDLKPLSSSTDSNLDEKPELNETPEFRHQEIVGPTVERDVSALANEMRQVIEGLMKTIFKLSNAIAVLGLVQLSFGAWISYTTKASLLSVLSIQSITGFAFPFSLAFLLSQLLKPMGFFRKMEEIGRLQILSNAIAVFGLVQLCFGAWISYTTRNSALSVIPLSLTFVFPFSLAFLLRQLLKPMGFFRKMEEIGSLQILTLSLEIAKSLNTFFARVHVVSTACAVGMSAGLFLIMFPK